MILQRFSLSRVKIVLLALLLGLSAGLPVLLNLWVAPSALIDEMRGGLYRNDDLFDPLDYGHGLYASETAPDGTTFRWSNAHASLTFPYAANAGRLAHIRMRLADWAASTPVSLTVSLNGKSYPPVTVSNVYQVYSFTLDTTQNPNPYLDPTHIQVDIQVPTTLAQDKRQLGAAIDWIEVSPGRSPGEVADEAVIWAIFVALVMLVAYSRVTLGWSAAYGAGTLLTLVVLYLTYIPRGIPPFVEEALAGLAWVLGVRLGSRARPLWGVALAGCGIWLVVAGRVIGDWQMDDAYISYRYAWNLAHGHGLVYNSIGPVVEGYTNFLWTLLAAFVLMVQLHPPAIMLAANIAFSIGIVSLTYYISKMLAGDESVYPLIAAGLLLVDGAIVTYGARGSGMESIAFSFFVLLAAALLWLPKGEKIARWHALAGLTLSIALLLRPEGLLAAAIFIGVKTYQDRRKGRWIGSLLATLVPFMAIVIPYQVWRVSFYGYPFPNTFYAKTGATVALLERGGEYVSVFLGERWLLTAFSLLCLLLLALRKKLTGLRAGLALFTAVYMLYVVWAGGDHFPGWRFLVPVVPLLVLLAQEAARLSLRALPSEGRAWRWGVATLTLVMLGYAMQALWLQEPQSVIGELTKLHTTYVNRWGSAGLWLKKSTPQGALTAAKGAGAIAFYSEHSILDVYGLNDLYIGHLQMPNMGTGNAGHDKQDPAYVLSQHPDYILDEWLGYFQPVKGRVKQEYQYEIHRLPTGPEIAWWHRNGR